MIIREGEGTPSDRGFLSLPWTLPLLPDCLGDTPKNPWIYGILCLYLFSSDFICMPAPRNGRKHLFRASKTRSLGNPVRPGGGGGIGFTTVYASPAVPSFRAGGCYLCLNDISAFPPARVLPDGKTRIRHLARIGLLPDSWDGHRTPYTMNEA